MSDFLEFEPKSLSDAALQDMIHKLSDSEAHREKLRECQREQVLRAMKNADLTQNEIIRTLCGSVTYEQMKLIAREWAPILGLSTTEFLKIARYR